MMGTFFDESASSCNRARPDDIVEVGSNIFTLSRSINIISALKSADAIV